MQSLVPRAIGMIEFGTEGDNSTVARYKITKMNSNPNLNSVQMIWPTQNGKVLDSAQNYCKMIGQKINDVTCFDKNDIIFGGIAFLLTGYLVSPLNFIKEIFFNQGSDF